MAEKNLGMVTAYAHAVAGGYTGTKEEFQNLLAAIPSIIVEMQNYPDDAYVEEGVAYFTHNGEPLFEITGIGGGGGGGGGGSGNNAILTVTNTSGWLSKTISEGASCPISLNWSSLEDDVPTGDGFLTVKVNGATRINTNIHQGDVSFDVSRYLSSGQNAVRVTVADVYSNTRTVNFTVSMISLTIKSSFDDATPKTGAIQFPYIPNGNVEKTVYFIVDGQTVGTEVTSASGRQQTYTIPEQEYGSHSLLVYFEAEVNGETVRSNELYYSIICINSSGTAPIIASSFRQTTAEQFSTISIPYIVYDPSDLTSSIQLYVNNELISEQTVDRTQQIWSYRADIIGPMALKIKAGSTEKIFNIDITESAIDAKVTTESLVLSLQAAGRSNNEEHPDTWVYENISCQFSGFNHKSDGWQLDNDGNTVLRIGGDARLTIPYKMFQTDFRASGKTIEIDFSTRDVLNYDSVIVSCVDAGRGLLITAQGASLTSEQASISSQYKENEHVRLSFVVEKKTENRLIYIYLNGVMSGVVQYPTDDDFSQITPKDITIGSSTCTIDVYSIRVYDNDLTRNQMLDNWIADTQSIDTMLDRYARNNVYDEYDNIVSSKLPTTLPYMVISCPELPQYKGDKKTVSVSFVDLTNPSKSFTATGVQADVQGTSSQFYARKNYKLKFKNGFDVNGETVSKYQMRANSIATNTFTMKADVASSEGANNVELARLYNDACPYKTPGQVSNSSVRQGIDGFPIVIFWDNGTDTVFVGKYNFNNDKGTPEVFGFANDDESWEIKNNTSDRVIWKSNNYSGSDWLNDFEARYPDTDPPYTDPTQLSEFATWLATTDRDKATGNALPSPVTYGTGDDAVTYTNDTAAYRLAKFKDEADDYMELNSALFYYLFTELFLMVDSRAKNAFPSFMGGVYE